MMTFPKYIIMTETGVLVQDYCYLINQVLVIFRFLSQTYKKTYNLVAMTSYLYTDVAKRCFYKAIASNLSM